jgi:uncharacterized protein (UPF0276 family)
VNSRPVIKSAPELGLGIGWRPELAYLISQRTDIGFVEVLAENLELRNLPAPLLALRERGIVVIPHGVSLSLGGAESIDAQRVEKLARLAEKFDSPFVSEHIAFVRAGDTEIGHLTPLARTASSLEVLVENVQAANKLLPVPLALENIAALFDWPKVEMDEAEFVTAALEATNTLLLLDLSNSFANAHNRRVEPLAELARFPLERLAYVHMGGGVEHDGIIHDTHGDSLLPGALDLLARFCALKRPAGVMLERDENFGGASEIESELDKVKCAMNLR